MEGSGGGEQLTMSLSSWGSRLARRKGKGGKKRESISRFSVMSVMNMRLSRSPQRDSEQQPTNFCVSSKEP